MRDLLDQARSRTPGCCAVSTEVWRGGRPTARLTSHPDLGQLHGASRLLTDSPMRTAADTLLPVRVDDILVDQRWPEFCATALRLGLRSLASAVILRDGYPVTGTVYSLRPRGLPGYATSLATAMLHEGGIVLSQLQAYAGLRRETMNLTAAIAAREVVEQAKGFLMHARNCDADEAYAELRRTAREGNMRVSEAARWLVTTRPAS